MSSVVVINKRGDVKKEKLKAGMIRKIRKDYKLTQTGMAKVIGCTQANVSKMENGSASPTLRHAFLLAKLITEQELIDLLRYYGEER